MHISIPLASNGCSVIEYIVSPD